LARCGERKFEISKSRFQVSNLRYDCGAFAAISLSLALLKGVLNERCNDGTILGSFGPGDANVATDGIASGSPDGRQHVRGAALQDEVREMHRRLQDALQVRRRNVVRHAAESLQDAVRRAVQLLLHVQRHGMLQMLICQLPLQMRNDERRLLHHLHQRRQAMLRNAASLLRLLHEVLRKRLLLLRVLQQHASLLRHLLIDPASDDWYFDDWHPSMDSMRASKKAPEFRLRGFFFW
jgi:hypothetical protein